MSILKKLTLAEIRHHKSRFIVTVAGIALSTALLSAVLLGIDSVMVSMRRTVAAQTGDYDWMATGKGTDRSNAATLELLSSSGLFAKLGYACDLTGALASDLGRVAVLGVGGDAWELLGAEVAEGRLPGAENEAAVYADHARQHDLSVGSILALPENGAGRRALTVTAILAEFHIDDHFAASPEAPALILTPLSAPPEHGLLYFWGRAASRDAGTLQAMLDLNAPLSGGDASRFQGWLNTSLLAWSGVRVPVEGEDLLSLIGALRLFLLLLVAAAAALMIGNSFSISLTERRRSLGMLASVGAAPGQRAVCILYEALAAGALGIPLGLAASCAGLAIAFFLIDPLVRQLSERYVEGFALSLSVRPVWLVLSAAAALGVVLASACIPALHAGRISPVDAIRGTGGVKISRRALCGGGLFGRVFGFAYTIARKNARRSIHRYRVTLLSLTMSVILTVTASGFAQYLETAYSMGHRESDYDITARLDSYDLTADLTAAPGWETLHAPQNAQRVKIRETIQWGAVSLPADRFSRQQQTLSAENPGQAAGLPPAIHADGSLSMSPCLIVLPDEEYASLTGTAAACDGKTLDCVLVNRYLFTGASGGYTDVRGQTNLEPGDRIEWDFNTMPLTLKIGMVLDGEDVPDELVRRVPSAFTITFVSSRSAVDRVFARFTAETGGYCRRNFVFSYQAKDRGALMEELDALDLGASEYTVTDQARELAALSAGMTLVRAALYGFTALVALVCAANIANTVSSGMTLRRREFAALRSVGMTPESLRRVIFWESGIYAQKALCWGLPVSFVLLWLVHRRLGGLYGFPFFLPWKAVAAAGVCVILLSLCAAWPALRRAGSTSPADDLRSEE